MSYIFSIVDIATVAERILDTESCCKRTIGAQHITPCVIGVGNNGITIGTVHQRHYVTLKILDIVIELGCCRTRAGVGHLTYPGGGRVLFRAICIAVGPLVGPVCHGGQAA